MNELIYIVIGSLIGGVTLFIINKIQIKSVDNATLSDKTLNEARAEADNIKNSKILQAKEKFLELNEHEKYILSKDADHNYRKQNLKLKENEVNQKSKKIEKLKTDSEEKIKPLIKK